MLFYLSRPATAPDMLFVSICPPDLTGSYIGEAKKKGSFLLSALGITKEMIPEPNQDPTLVRVIDLPRETIDPAIHSFMYCKLSEQKPYPSEEEVQEMFNPKE